MAARGGKRQGAGRKSKAQKLLEASFVAEWFTPSFQEIKWKKLCASEDENVVFKTLSYLTDRLYGKAVQPQEVSGPDGGAIPVSLEIDL